MNQIESKVFPLSIILFVLLVLCLQNQFFKIFNIPKIFAINKYEIAYNKIDNFKKFFKIKIKYIYF